MLLGFWSLKLLWKAILSKTSHFKRTLVVCFSKGHFAPPACKSCNEFSPPINRGVIFLTATHLDFTWSLHLQLSQLLSIRLSSLCVCWQSERCINTPCASISLHYSFISMATTTTKIYWVYRTNKDLISDINCLLFYFYFFQPTVIMSVGLVWSRGENAPLKSVELYLETGTCLACLWTNVLGHDLGKTARQQSYYYLCEESTSRKLILPPSNFPYRLHLKTLFFHLNNT